MTEKLNSAQAKALRQSLVERMKALNGRFPGEDTFASILAQLEYIADFLMGGTKKMPRRNEINFGFLGMRFVREFDTSVAHDLATLDTYVEQNFQ